MKILAIETSCDETAAAVVEDGQRVLSSVVWSQAAAHAPYGGVVPELASRHHIEKIVPVIQQAMSEAGLDYPDLDAIAVTEGPGLIGSLLIGMQVAKGIAFVHGKPLVPVNHIAGHIQAPFLSDPNIPLPALALVVSGGHTSLFLIPALGEYQLVGRTRDDAAGEAFDKVARLLGLGYPGGPIIDRMSEGANEEAVAFKIAKISDGRPDFSFSGLKTAVRQHVRDQGWTEEWTSGQPTPTEVRDLVASVQYSIVRALCARLRDATKMHRPKSLLVTGGVAANRRLRTEATRVARDLGLPLYVPPISLSTDNAAMIGAAAYLAYNRGTRAGWGHNPSAQLPLTFNH